MHLFYRIVLQHDAVDEIKCMYYIVGMISKDHLLYARSLEPMLTTHGIGVQDTNNSQDVLDEDFARIRLESVDEAVNILLQCRKLKHINKGRGSYGLKHIIEHATGSYLTNGELIAAMLIAGFTHKPDGYFRSGRLSPNASFNIAEASVKKIEEMKK